MSDDKMLIKTEERKKIVKMDTSNTVEGREISYAIVTESFDTLKDIKTGAEEEIKRPEPRVEILQGKSKQDLIDLYTQTRDVANAKRDKIVSEADSILAVLEER
jgi:hypothetical protein